jgi:protein involved in polysaccharide export with SLBB domain
MKQLWLTVPLLLFAFCAAHPPAARAQVDATAATTSDASAVLLAAADQISLKFQDPPELSGDYRVASDGTLSVPVVGRIAIADLSLGDLEQVLSQRVTEFTGRPTYVTVEVTAFRPVYVTGFVSRPGAVEWRPGLTVLQAEALAGGLYRPPEQTDGLGGSRQIEAMRQLRKAHDAQKRLLSRLSRLEAERAGVAEVVVPATLVSLVGEPEARSLIEGEQALLERSRSALEAQIAALERGSVLAGEELGGLQDQSLRVDEQLEVRRNVQQDLDSLQERGIVTRDRTIEGRIRILELEEKAINLAVARANVRGTAAELERQAVTLRQDREATLGAEIAETRAALAEAVIDYESARESYNRLGESALMASANLGTHPVIRYTVVRQGAAGEERIEAGTSSHLRPGDVLLVSQEFEQNTTQGHADEGAETRSN